MSDEELAQFLATMARFTEEHAATPEMARRVLMEEGVVDEQGQLTPFYR